MIKRIRDCPKHLLKLYIINIEHLSNKEKTQELITSLPSRKRQRIEVNGGLKKNPLAKFRAAVRMALLMQRLVDFLVAKKKEKKKKKKKGEILDVICKVN